MTPAELAALFRFLRARLEEGFFVRCWTTNEEGASLLRRGETAIQSMWSPIYNALGPVAPFVAKPCPKKATAPGMAA